MSDGIELLLVEDHAGDVKLTRAALGRLPYSVNLHVAVDGFEAMDFLCQRGRFAKAPRPKIILLDLNMPRKDGRQVLREIEHDPDLRTIPTIILTTSSEAHDVTEAYRLCANSYHAKPVAFEDFVTLLGQIFDYWLGCAKTPP